MQVHHDRAMIWRCLRNPNDVGGVYHGIVEPALNVDERSSSPKGEHSMPARPQECQPVAIAVQAGPPPWRSLAVTETFTFGGG